MRVKNQIIISQGELYMSALIALKNFENRPPVFQDSDEFLEKD